MRNLQTIELHDQNPLGKTPKFKAEAPKSALLT
jgi:hypothetical protein